MTWALMTPREKKLGAIIALANVFVSFVDTVSLVGVMPLVSLIIEPDVLTKNRGIALIHEILGKPDLSDFILLLAAGAISLIALSVVLNLSMMWVVKNYRIKCQDRLAHRLVAGCVNARYAWLLNQNSTTLAHYVFNDVLSWSSGAIHGLMAIVSHVSLLILVLAVILSAAALSGIIGLVVVGVFATVVMVSIRSRISRLSAFRRTAAASSFSFASEFLSGIKDVKLSGRESAFIGIYDRTFNHYGEAMGTLKLLQAFPPLVMLLLGQASIILIALILWRVGMSGGEIAAEMALVLLLTARAVPATTRLSNEIGALWNVIPNLEGIHGLLPQLVAGQDPHGDAAGSDPFADWRRVTFEDVEYSYSSDRQAALLGISTVFERGKSYGVVGPTGSGKTTLIDIFLGLLEPTKGGVHIDGKPLTGMNIRPWQKRIGYVPQSPLIIDDTLLANVAFGVAVGQVDRDRAARCLEMANLKDVLDSVGLDGPLGEQGNRLSGGQRQRVAIARVLYDSPEILVLDEATSALDSLSERAIQDALDNLRGNVTTLTIAHRFSTIAGCSQILVLKTGRLIAAGTYAELMESSDLFRKMASSSASSYPTTAVAGETDNASVEKTIDEPRSKMAAGPENTGAKSQ